MIVSMIPSNMWYSWSFAIFFKSSMGTPEYSRNIRSVSLRPSLVFPFLPPFKHFRTAFLIKSLSVISMFLQHFFISFLFLGDVRFFLLIPVYGRFHAPLLAPPCFRPPAESYLSTEYISVTPFWCEMACYTAQTVFTENQAA